MVRDILLLTIFPATMILAAAMDILTFTIPNRLSIVLIVGFFLLALLVPLTWSDIGLHVLAGAGMLSLGFVLFACGWIGGGDAKLFAGAALWLGPGALPKYLLIASLFGGALTLALILWRGRSLPAMLTSQGWLLRLHDRREGIPYGIALAAAGLLVYSDTPFMAALGG